MADPGPAAGPGPAHTAPDPNRAPAGDHQDSDAHPDATFAPHGTAADSNTDTAAEQSVAQDASTLPLSADVEMLDVEGDTFSDVQDDPVPEPALAEKSSADPVATIPSHPPVEAEPDAKDAADAPHSASPTYPAAPEGSAPILAPDPAQDLATPSNPVPAEDLKPAAGPSSAAESTPAADTIPEIDLTLAEQPSTLADTAPAARIASAPPVGAAKSIPAKDNFPANDPPTTDRTSVADVATTEHPAPTEHPAAAAPADAPGPAAAPPGAGASTPSDSETDPGITPGPLTPLQAARLLGEELPEGGLAASELDAAAPPPPAESGERQRVVPPPATTPAVDSDSESYATEDDEDAIQARLDAFTPTAMLPGLKFRPFQLLKRSVVVPGVALRICEVVRLTFRLPEDETLGFRPLLDEHIKVYIPWTPKPKSYSPTSSPNRKGSFDICVKQYPGGRYSNHLCRLRIGDTALMAGPFPIPRFPYKRRGGRFVGIVAFGIAITSALPLIRAELQRGEAQKIVLIHANRWRSEVALDAQTRRLVRKSRGKLVVHRLFSRDRGADIVHGKVGTQYLRKCFKFDQEKQKRFYVVGNKAMIKSTWDKLWNLRYFKSKNALLRKGIGGTRDVPEFKKPRRKKRKKSKKKEEKTEEDADAGEITAPVVEEQEDGEGIEGRGDDGTVDGDKATAAMETSRAGNEGNEEIKAVDDGTAEKGDDGGEKDKTRVDALEEDKQDEKEIEAVAGDDKAKTAGSSSEQGKQMDNDVVAVEKDAKEGNGDGQEKSAEASSQSEEQGEEETRAVGDAEKGDGAKVVGVGPEKTKAGGGVEKEDGGGGERKAKGLGFLKKSSSLVPGILRKRQTL